MQDLRETAVNALHWNFAIPRDRVTAEVNRGVITLQGLVERAYERSCAEATVRLLSGVVDVQNNIAIGQAHAADRANLRSI